MASQHRFHLERTDAISGGDDYVVGAALEVQVAVVVLTHLVPGAPQAGRRRLAQVAQEEGRHGGRVHHQLAGVDERPDPGQRPPHRAGSSRYAVRIGRDLAGLGLAVAVPDVGAGGLPPHPQRLRVEGLAGRHQRVQTRDRLEHAALGHEPVFGGGHAPGRHAFLRRHRNPLGRIEPGVVQQRSRAAQPGRDEGVAGRLRPAAGWSEAARNAFIAPWLCGAAALLHDARFDPAERIAVAAEEGVAAWCMAPTEYRLMAKRGVLQPIPSLHSLVAAGEALDPETLRMWREGTGVDVRDGYGQTETGQVTANPYGVPARPGSMGRPLPGIRAFVDAGELVVDPATVPTFFLRYLGQPPPAGLWRTGDQVRQDDDGYLYFESRTDDVIISAGYRIGPFEVESVLARHPAVADVAVVAASDAERGSVVRAIVVLQPGRTPSAGLASELQDFVKARTAPYKLSLIHIS